MKKRILIADDDEGIRDIFTIIFQKAGYDIEVKDDASDILKNQFIVPDLFLIDKLISGIDGVDVCRHLKNNPETSAIPVVMVSAAPDLAIIASKAGADDFIEKPFDLNQLLRIVEKNIRPKRKE